ncbi:TIGR03364 family FAD-dependent oxidoreductase [Lewinella sp. IMCC34191]|uniref:TIGR03364 family FAD-dependent oxidoreductase n=1 Tax=Lewinella sp. IMCC34191 TaxID=2259172 RepID=UPI000E27F946|nr:TIGR03364 family FAD-dependent oxidoreductase [Lewinella sp. IMCC34191]
MTQSDLLIVGGGVLGTFHAAAALERGLSVTLCEASATPRGATVRNFGQIVPSGMQPRWQAHGRRSLAIYQDLQSRTDITLRQLGSVYLASDYDELGLLEEMAVINWDNGYPSHLLTAAECRKRYPGLREDYCVGGLFFPEEVTVEAREMIGRVLAYLTAEKGLNYRPGHRVVKLKGGGARVQARDNHGNQYRAERAIVCSGGDFGSLFPDRLAASDLELCKLQMLRIAAGPGPELPGNILTGLSIRRYESFRDCPSYARVKETEDPGAFWKQWGVHILFKQSPDGSIILGDTHEYASAREVDALSFENRPRLNEYMLDEAKKIFDLPRWTIDASWNGYYSQCREHDIHLETIGDRIHVVTGIGGKGMTAGPGFSAAHIDHLYAGTPLHPVTASKPATTPS